MSKHFSFGNSPKCVLVSILERQGVKRTLNILAQLRQCQAHLVLGNTGSNLIMGRPKLGLAVRLIAILLTSKKHEQKIENCKEKNNDPSEQLIFRPRLHLHCRLRRLFFGKPAAKRLMPLRRLSGLKGSRGQPESPSTRSISRC